jgi:hypothetical protein
MSVAVVGSGIKSYDVDVGFLCLLGSGWSLSLSVLFRDFVKMYF